MEPCRFIRCSDSCVYTTANEIGKYLLSKNVKLNVHCKKCNKYHFGDIFNKRLNRGLNKLYKSANNSLDAIMTTYTQKDFPKINISDGNNDSIIKRLISLNMCSDSSVRPVVMSSRIRALNLYTLDAFKALINSYGIVYNSEEVVVVDTIMVYPITTIPLKNPSQLVQKKLFI